MGKHSTFIKTPILEILKDSANATYGMNLSITNFPIYEYILQSTFIKMTGFQEQKMKCIAWELATNDYDYRYKNILSSKLGECSNHQEKNTIFFDFIKILNKLNEDDINQELVLKEDIYRKKFLNPTKEKLTTIIKNSNLCLFNQKKFLEYEHIIENLLRENIEQLKIFTKKDKTKTILKTIYTDHLYKNRNRIAHNLLSYQQNLPDLSLLIREENKYENYFLWFFLLILIDEIFMYLYAEHYEPHFLD